MADSQLDLGKLSIDRSEKGTEKIRGRSGRWLTRYGVPAAILVGFGMLLTSALGEHWGRTHSVRVVPVIVKRTVARQPGSPLFQAAGWIEPRPTSVTVAALAPGVIESLVVVEGERVSKGAAIARLIDTDAQLQVDLAETALAIREGELKRAQAEKAAAKTRLERPVHLRALLADAKSLLARATTEKEKLPFLVKAAQATVDFTRTSMENKQEAKQAVAGVIIGQAVKEHAQAVASLQELQQRGRHLQREIDAMQEKVDALSVQLELLVEEKRQLEEADAKLASAVAFRDEARLELRKAELNLERTVVRAPIDGRILRLVASPGTRVMGLGEAGRQSSSTVVEMYDPSRLQVRADVRLEDVPLVSRGAPVEVRTASSADPILGRVLRSTSAANIQKNTLEVKVELIDPPLSVAPEMLVTATFLAEETDAPSDDSAREERLFVSGDLVRSDGGTTSVWVIDADQQVRLKSVTPGMGGPDGLIEIVEGLNATDKLIASSDEDLRDGDHAVIEGEDLVMGVER